MRMFSLVGFQVEQLPFSRINTKRHPEGANGSHQAQQYVETILHRERLHDPDHPGDPTAKHSKQHRDIASHLLIGHFPGQSESDNFIRDGRPVCATDWTVNCPRHPSADRFHVKGIPLTAPALNFHRYHKAPRLIVAFRNDNEGKLGPCQRARVEKSGFF